MNTRVCYSSLSLPSSPHVRIWSPMMKWILKSHIIAIWSVSHWKEIFKALKKNLPGLLETSVCHIDLGCVCNWWCTTSCQNLSDTGVLTPVCQSFALNFLLFKFFGIFGAGIFVVIWLLFFFFSWKPNRFYTFFFVLTFLIPFWKVITFDGFMALTLLGWKCFVPTRI